MLGATYVQRHPKTGKYLFRRKVPDHLRIVIGKREITKSLYTHSLNVAKRRSRVLADETDDLFAKARRLAGYRQERSPDASSVSVADRHPDLVGGSDIEPSGKGVVGWLAAIAARAARLADQGLDARQLGQTRNAVRATRLSLIS